MKRFLLTMIVAATVTIGCNAPKKPPTSAATAAAWTPQISAAMGIASLATGSVLPDDTTKVKRSQCTKCSGTGKVMSGDGILQLDCDNCVPDNALSDEEIQQLRQGLKKMAALEKYQTDMQAWVKNDMEKYVLASVKKRATFDATLNPANTTSKLDQPDAVVPDQGVVRVVQQPAAATNRVVVRRGWFGRRGRTYVSRDGYASSTPVRYYAGSCAGGSCSY
jgi:ribosomal protein S13